MTALLLSQAIPAFLLDKRLSGCSDYTLRNYKLTLTRLQAALEGDPDIADITTDQLRTFLGNLMTSRVAPAGVAPRPARRLSAKTVRNIHTCLCSFYTWAVDEDHVAEHLPRGIDVPTPEPPVIEPFTKEQVKLLLANLSYSAPWERIPETATERPRKRQLRDRALLLFLLDTGIRATELCNLTLGDVDLVGGSARVQSKGRMNTGQGKSRVVRFSPATAKAMQRYLTDRKALGGRPDTPLFTTRDNRHFDRHYLSKHLHRLGRRAGVSDVHAHRFRHTFAITYLRNGGDIYTLQDLLGHTSLEMVRRYLHIAQVDIESAHRRASPVENWRL